MSPSRLPELLGGLATLFRAPFADVFSREHDGANACGLLHGLDRADYDQGMIGTWSSRNPWAKKAPVMSAGAVRATWQFLSRDELVRSDMFADYLDVRDLHEGLRFEIWSDEAGIEDISLLRPFRIGPFSLDEIARARALMPHLQRAAAMRRRLQRAELMADAGLNALETLSHGVVLLDRLARPVYVNPAASYLLARRDAVAYDDRRLNALDPKSARAFTALLDRATLGEGRARAGAMLLPSTAVNGPIVALGMPLRLTDGETLPGHPAAIVCFSRAWMSVSEHALRPVSSLFGLTAAETKLAARLLSGDSIAEIAQSQSRSLATMRTHLARLMAKTDTTRQSELLLRLIEIPRLPADQTID